MYMDAADPRRPFLTLSESERLLTLLQREGEDDSTLARKLARARRGHFNSRLRFTREGYPNG